MNLNIVRIYLFSLFAYAYCLWVSLCSIFYAKLRLQSEKSFFRHYQVHLNSSSHLCYLYYTYICYKYEYVYYNILYYNTCHVYENEVKGILYIVNNKLYMHIYYIIKQFCVILMHRNPSNTMFN